MSESIKILKEEFRNWDYSGNEEGDYYRHCMECGVAIEQDEYVLVETYSYKDRVLYDIWHIPCSLIAEARMLEFSK